MISSNPGKAENGKDMQGHARTCKNSRTSEVCRKAPFSSMITPSLSWSESFYQRSTAPSSIKRQLPHVGCWSRDAQHGPWECMQHAKEMDNPSNPVDFQVKYLEPHQNRPHQTRAEAIESCRTYRHDIYTIRSSFVCKPWLTVARLCYSCQLLDLSAFEASGQDSSSPNSLLWIEQLSPGQVPCILCPLIHPTEEPPKAAQFQLPRSASGCLQRSLAEMSKMSAIGMASSITRLWA